MHILLSILLLSMATEIFSLDVTVPSKSANYKITDEMTQPEVNDTKRVVKTFSKKILSEYVKGYARRNVHAKANGCVKAELSINENIQDANLTRGIFKPGSKYKALIRFSNGSTNGSGDDHDGDTRGMAIKVFGVSGNKLIADPIFEDSQDFILLSHHSFFLNNSKDSAEFFERFDSGKISEFLRIPFSIGLHGTITAAEMLSQHIDNPLFTRYYSVTPYQLGHTNTQPHVVRYSVRACKSNVHKQPEKISGKNFLRNTMQATLQNESACMELMLQDRGLIGEVEIDNYDNWSEDKFPFTPIAKLTIPSQVFDTADQNNMCEKLSYNPWHSIVEHKPLGIINAMRGEVYEKTSTLRRTMNGNN